MAHAVVEWTDNLEKDGFAVRPLLELIAREMREADGVFPWGRHPDTRPAVDGLCYRR
jgi:hypothetical protein